MHSSESATVTAPGRAATSLHGPRAWTTPPNTTTKTRRQAAVRIPPG
jgi:hypothetical protein